MGSRAGRLGREARHRVLVPAEAVQGDVVTITEPGRVHHLSDVLRVKVGERLACFDGEGRAWIGPLIRRARRELTVQIEERVTEPDAACRIRLLQALIKPERFDWLVQKATELGVDRIVPVMTARTQARLPQGRAAEKTKRWQRIAEEAAAQCGRLRLPMIEPPQPFERLWTSREHAEWAIIPTLAVEAAPLREVLLSQGRVAEAAVWIGPEGDFTEAEVETAVAHGARPVSLGTRVLKSETAALVTLAVLTQCLER